MTPSCSSRGPGSASISFVNTDEKWYGYIENYLATATPDPNATFSHWEIRTLEGRESSFLENPLSVSTEYYNEGGWQPSSVASVVAVFENPNRTVTVRSLPENVAKLTGGGTYRLDQTCTIHAEEKCSPWLFLRWEIQRGGVTFTASQRTYTFPVSDDTVCTAVFTHTNTRNPYVEGGSILMTNSGDILYDGDAV